MIENKYREKQAPSESHTGLEACVNRQTAQMISVERQKQLDERLLFGHDRIFHRFSQAKLERSFRRNLYGFACRGVTTFACFAL